MANTSKLNTSFVVHCPYCQSSSKDSVTCYGCGEKLLAGSDTDRSWFPDRELLDLVAAHQIKNRERDAEPKKDVIAVDLTSDESDEEVKVKKARLCLGGTASLTSSATFDPASKKMVDLIASNSKIKLKENAQQYRKIEKVTVMSSQDTIHTRAESELLNEEFPKSNLSSTQLTKCTLRSVRVGSYKVFVPSPILSATIYDNGVVFDIPHCTLNDVIVCSIPRNEIVSIKAHFSYRLHMVIISTTPSYASLLRNKLGMCKYSTSVNYYCPLDGGHGQKYIILLPAKLGSNVMDSIKKMYQRDITEIDFVEANSILYEGIDPN